MALLYERIFNFSAGPGALPVEVLEQVRDEMLNWQGSGMGVMEMSHRGKHYESIHQATQENLKTLLGMPDGYRILFLQGGATLQNTMVPMNLLGEGTADYIITGSWGQKSEQAAKLVGKVNRIYDGKAEGFRSVPDPTQLSITEGAAYIHLTTNETIQGVQFQSDFELPAPVVADASSDILSRPMDVSKYGLIYAGAQKNMGPSGVTLVIIREDLLGRTPESMHPMLDYRLMAENDSLYNTPPTFAIYVCGLVYQWLLKQGGLAAMQAQNQAKASRIYGAIDASEGFYRGHAAPEARSTMNITFTLPDEDRTKEFLKQAQTHGLDGLKGHRSVGGCRASVYNAFPPEGCDVLADFMKSFVAANA